MAGFAAILLLASLLGCGFSALSNGLALVTRREETLIAIINFFGLPLTFLSTAFMASNLMPPWIRFLAKGNPVNWAVDAARDAMLGRNWDGVAWRALMLLAFALASIAAAILATLASPRAARNSSALMASGMPRAGLALMPLVIAPLALVNVIE